MSNGEIGWMFGAFLLMAGAMLTGLSATDTRAEPFFLGAPLAKYEFQRDLENFRDGALQNLDATYMTLKAIPVTFLAEIATVVLFLTFLIWIIRWLEPPQHGGLNSGICPINSRRKTDG
jgi:hypothetical protein